MKKRITCPIRWRYVIHYLLSRSDCFLHRFTRVLYLVGILKLVFIHISLLFVTLCEAEVEIEDFSAPSREIIELHEMFGSKGIRRMSGVRTSRILIPNSWTDTKIVRCSVAKCLDQTFHTMPEPVNTPVVKSRNRSSKQKHKIRENTSLWPWLLSRITGVQRSTAICLKKAGS